MLVNSGGDTQDQAIFPCVMLEIGVTKEMAHDDKRLLIGGAKPVAATFPYEGPTEETAKEIIIEEDIRLEEIAVRERQLARRRRNEMQKQEKMNRRTPNRSSSSSSTTVPPTLLP